jgi:alkyl hydroperoxide reductase subunit F
MLDGQLKEQLETHLTRLRRPIQLTAWLDDGEASGEMRALLEDLASASDELRVVEAEASGERTPSFAIHGVDEAPRVRFAGMPLGHEFTSLVLALLHVGGHPPRESDSTLEQIRSVNKTLRFETFFSVSCQNCPDVVQALNTMAALNPNVEHVAIDGSLFQDEVEQRQVMAVPTVFVNGEPFGQGRMELDEILSRLDEGAAARKAQELSDKGTFDVLIVGGGPAGAAAAIYAARKGLSTGIVTERFGGQVLDTAGIENFISVPETEGPRFAAALEAHVAAYPVDVMRNQRVERLEPGPEHAVHLHSGATLRARTVVLAPGARWRNMNVPGEQEYRTRGVTYCPHCDGPLFKGKRVAVIGGGNSGVEAAIDLAGVVSQVTVLEFLDELKADAVLQRKLASLPNVDVRTAARTTEVRGDGKKVVGLTYEDRHSGEQHSLDVDGVFVQIGLLPNTEWLRGTVELNDHGEIPVGQRGETSVPGVFAAGDATTVPYKQIVIATGEGARAALGAFDYLIRATAPAA